MAEPTVASLTLDPGVVVGAGTVRGTVTLGTHAPSGGVSVALAADHPAIGMPPSITVHAGQQSAGFQVEAGAVRMRAKATVRAAAGGVTRSAELVLRPPRPLLEAIWVDPARVLGGDPVTAMIGLGFPAPAGGAAFAVDASAGAKAPARVDVPADADASDPFVVETPQVATETACLLRASGDGRGVWAEVVLEARPYLLSAFTVSANVVDVRIFELSWTVTLTNVAPVGGIPVAISLEYSTSEYPIDLPESVTVPEGSASASFGPASGVGVDLEVCVRATLGPTSIVARFPGDWSS